MAMSSWMIRRSIRQRSRPAPEDCYEIDAEKSARENAEDIFMELYSPQITVKKRLSLLNALIKLIQRWKREACMFGQPKTRGFHGNMKRCTGLAKDRETTLGFSCDQMMGCLKCNLLHPMSQIRAATLRTIRHLLIVPSDLRQFNVLQLPHLVCRSLDIVLQNTEERMQALKLIRRMLAVASNEINPAVVRCLVSLGESGSAGMFNSGTGTLPGVGAHPGHEDRLLRCCLATLCEVGVLNPIILIKCGGVSVITRSILECHSPRIAESLCGVLLYMLEWPHTRNIAAIRLDCFVAPYCDFTYRVGILDRNKDARDLRFTCSRLALLSVLRSWAGTIEFCNPLQPSGLKALIDIMYLNQLEIRKAVLELLYELLGLTQPVWTDEYLVAMQVVDPAEYQDAWRLNEGFVGAEGISILPSLASNVPKLCEIHIALLLYCFVEHGLLNALIEVIVSSDTFISVRATILLAKITHQLHHLLPAEICDHTPAAALPMLVAHAIGGNHQARAAISALQQLHVMLQNRPASCSFYLDCIIQRGELINTRTFRRELLSNNATTSCSMTVGGNYSTQEETKRTPLEFSHWSAGMTMGRPLGQFPSSNDSSMTKLSGPETGDRSLDKRTLRRSKILNIWDSLKEGDRLIKESNVLLVKDPNMWDWDVIITILRSDILGVRMEEQNNRFIRRLVDYFKPSNNRFSHQDLVSTNRQLPAYVTAGLELIDTLLRSPELECIRILTDLFTDISRQLLAIHAKKSAHECLFSPQHMTSTMCQQYFLFIGRMCRTDCGMEILRNTDVFKELATIVQKTNHLCYIKLIISGLDYNMEGEPRAILSKALQKHPSVKARLYALQMLRVLLRARMPNFEVWGIQLMLDLVASVQGEGQPRCMQLALIDLLEEASYERVYLEELTHCWPQLDQLGERGKMIMMRFYSIPRGLNHPRAQVLNEIEQWLNIYNERYVLLIESDTHANLTQHIRTEDGTYSRRHCSSTSATGGGETCNLLPHLYGQLAQTNQGFSQLVYHGKLDELMDTLRDNRLRNERDSLRLKTALWAVCHACTSKTSLDYFLEHYPCLLPRLVQLVRSAEVYSIRAAALGGLCLIATTTQGVAALQKIGWASVRHDRSTNWPINEPCISMIPEMTSFSCIDQPDASISSSNMISFSGLDNVYGNQSERSDSNIRSPGRIGMIPTKLGASSSPQRSSDTNEDFATNRFQFSFLSRDLTLTNTSSVTDPVTDMFISYAKENYRKYRHMSYMRRPLLSISSMDDLEMDNAHCDRMLASMMIPASPPNLANLGSLASKPDTRWKITSLDRKFINSKKLIKNEAEPSGNATTRSMLQSKNTNSPCYIGICFPRNILHLFPEHGTPQTHVFYKRSEPPKLELPKEGKHWSDAGAPEHQNVSSGLSFSKYAEDDLLDYERVTKDIGPLSTGNTSESDDGVGNRKRWSHENHKKAQCLRCAWKLEDKQLRSGRNRTVPLLPKEDVLKIDDISNYGQLASESIANTILRHVQRMANPVWSKQSCSALLDITQSHPAAFKDVCLYSEVCYLLSHNTFRLASRRFLQELFLDLDFGSIYGKSWTTNDTNQEAIYNKTNTASRLGNSKDTTTTAAPAEQLSTGTGRPHIAQLPLPGVAAKAAGTVGGLGALLKSPPLASVYEASLENLNELSPVPGNKQKITRPPESGESRSVQSKVVSGTTRPPESGESGSTQSKVTSGDDSRLRSRPRFNTLELDLSCAKNKFPIRDRTGKDCGRPVSSSCAVSPSSVSSLFGTGSISAVTSPTQLEPAQPQVQFGSLFCEQRQHLKSSKSETTLEKHT
ncbi:rapamycin-insensitive companion of mTOR-like [Anopheles albimanus]|uniref:rapamycin-insensitive companion of mTOR-like n=1 Tax=Anopheles albimanus TaxID=7167 RepID=UPI00163F6574|nr:rapamycin-insensitive companion of mTOR-like [Anopheles albimanus]XP_035785777.1 rapamycin-insensitive companion of mTOR-like [Anopheles albimanus]